jgi:diguanylate cyclase (GGDEF)-like protein
MAGPAPPSPFNQPDLRILRGLEVLRRLALIFLNVIAGTVFCAWLVPLVGSLLPTGWDLMKANTALLMLLSGWSLFLSHAPRSSKNFLIGRLFAAAVVLIAAITLIEYGLGLPLGLDTFFAADSRALFPGRMSLQTAVSLLVVGLVLLGLRARKGVVAKLVDAGTLLLCLMILIYFAGYLFGATVLFGMTEGHRLSQQTLACLILLTLTVLSRRMECGFFSILIDDGIGGKTARLLAPCAVPLSFAVAESRGLAMRFQLIREEYAVALASSVTALVGFCFVVFIARRCQQLEAATRELSLRDQLTRLYNRRGFLLFAEQSLQLARRNGMEFFLLVIDVDGLKRVNDDLGHEAGSQQLQKMARLLGGAFRESDVIGRVGGDEFVVAGNGISGHATDFVARLQLAMDVETTTETTRYPLSFSLGQVTVAADNMETLQELIGRADLLMYEVKRGKTDHRAGSVQHESGMLHGLNHEELGLPT